MQAYLKEGEKQALSLGNRGLIRFRSNGTLEQDIISIHSQSLEDVYIDQQELQTHWANLQDSQRELLYLHCVLEYTAQEISDELNCPRGTVLARIHRLKKQLQKGQATTETQGTGS